MKFLLVDDNENVRCMLKAIIGTTSNEFCECSDGKGAVQAYSDFKPDFVLMDIMMTKMDGLTATKEILKKYPSAKIFIVTNYTDSEFVTEAEKIGALMLISKENLMAIPDLIQKFC